jgi:hypothetical protein
MATQSNRIELYKQNTKSIACVVIGVADVSGFTPYLTVKKNDDDTPAVLTKTGIVTDASGSLAFNLTGTDTSINSGDYVYDITIEKTPIVYTVVRDKFKVLEGVRY